MYHHHLLLQARISPTSVIRLLHPSLPTGLLDYIWCPYSVGLGKSLLVAKHLLVCLKGLQENVANEFVLTSAAGSSMP